MSNLKFKHTVNSFEQAEDLLCEQDVTDLRVAYNTSLAKIGDGYGIVHHYTEIIHFHPDGSATIDANWVSRTTANRLHHYKPEMVERVNSHIARDGAWYGITLKNHPGTFDIEQGEKYRIYPDRTVVRV